MYALIVCRYELCPQVGQLSVTGAEDVHLVLINRLGLSLPRKSAVRLTDRLDMTIAVTTKQQHRRRLSLH